MYASDLRERDVINVCTGRRLGCICDFSIDTDCGKITAILVSDRLFASSGKGTLCIPWEKICCIGKDAVLVQLSEQECLPREGGNRKGEKRIRSGWFFGG